MVKLLTAIVPVHQMGGKLQNLQSWLSESKEIDIILVHDFSNDSTQSELEGILNNSNFAHVLLTTGHYGSPGIARNAGFEKVKTDFVTFWDSDDLPNLGLYLEMTKILNEGVADVCLGGYKIVNLKDHSVEVVNLHSTTVNHEVALNPGVWRMVFRTSTIPKSPFRNHLLGEDHLFLQELKFASMEKAILGKAVYTYFYAGEGNLTSNKNLIPELTQVFNTTDEYRKKSVSNEELEFSSILLAREGITMIKSGQFLFKVKATLSLVKVFLSSNRRERRTLISAFKRILEEKL
jgi:glycosyltransferase involved in cell wall biosynthesis